MNILIVNNLYHPNKIGGAEMSVKALAEGFISSGMKVSVLTLGESDKFYQVNDVDVWQFKIENLYWPFNSQNKNTILKLGWHINDINNKSYDKKIKNVFDIIKPQILFTNNLSGFSTRIWHLAKSHNIKIIHTIRDYYLQCPKTTKFKRGRNCDSLCLDCKILTTLKKNNSNKIDYVVGISEFVLQDHLKEGYFKNVTNEIIYNGFKFDFEPKEFKFLNENKVTYGYIGQINKEKGVESMLKDFKGLENKENWSLLIAGHIGVEYLNYLKNLNNSNRITYLGYTNSKEFFEKIDILIVPSLWKEPFGRVVLEAMINNKIVITSKSGGLNELMINNQTFTFNSKTQELSKLLKYTLDNREHIAFNISKEFMTQFSIKKCVLKYSEIFYKLLDVKNLNT